MEEAEEDNRRQAVVGEEVGAVATLNQLTYAESRLLTLTGGGGGDGGGGGGRAIGGGGGRSANCYRNVSTRCS